jgi:ribosomal protein S18 acetylase RimI-like enzyme
MTTNREEIAVDQQVKWWFTVLKSGKTLEAYLLMDGHKAAGYGILRKKGIDEFWMTAGLAEAYRGKGLGRMLIAIMSELGYQDGRTPWIEVLDSNRAALVPDVKSGYRLVETIKSKWGDMHVMRHKHDREMDGFDTRGIL